MLHKIQQNKNKTEFDGQSLCVYIFSTIFGLVVTLNFDLICKKLQNHPQHVQFNSIYHHLVFYGDKMNPKVDFLTIFGLVTTLTLNFLISVSNQFTLYNNNNNTQESPLLLTDPHNAVTQRTLNIPYRII